jgi:hypothetical protein
MEKAYIEYLRANGLLGRMNRGKIIYADPHDLTKMLNIKTGPRPLPGVRSMQHLYYPKKAP